MHNNLCRFVGIIVDEGNWALVNEFCPKGSLREFFHNESMVIDWTFKYSIINDILAGLVYLHSTPLGYHGRLKSSNCLVNARFVVKLSDYGPHSLYEQMDEHSAKSRTNNSPSGSCDGDNDGKRMQGSKTSSNRHEEESYVLLMKKRLWIAPEHLITTKCSGSAKGDVYSLGLLLYEIVTNVIPFVDPATNDYVMPLSK